MPRDVNGNYTLPLPPVITGTSIDIAWANPTMDDVAATLTDSLSRSGAGGMLDVFKAVDGLVGAPGIAFVTEPTLGFFRPSAGVLGVAIGGALQAQFDAANKIAVNRDHGSGLQLFPVADSFTELAAGKTAFDTKFAGFADTGLHTEYQGDLDDITVNSVYSFSSADVTNEPTDFGAASGFIETVMGHTGVTVAVQFCYGRNGAAVNKIWMRENNSGWGAWKRVVDNGAFPLRYDGFKDDGLHTLFAGDMDTIAGNSRYVFLETNVTNGPTDLGLNLYGFIQTMFWDANNGAGVQTIYGMDGANQYKVWIRSKLSGTWQEWVLINDGGQLFIEGTTVFSSGQFQVGLPANPLFNIRIVNQNNLSNIYSYGSDDLSINTRFANNIRFKTGDVERMRLKNSGGNLEVLAAAPLVDADLTRKDYVDGLVGSGAIFDQKYDGFNINTRHDAFTGDADTIAINSLYGVNVGVVTGLPAEFVTGWGFLRTMIFPDNNSHGIQILYGMNTEGNYYKQWTRNRIVSVYGPWHLIVHDSVGKFYGEVSMYPPSITPSVGHGLLPAEGTLILRADYPECFDALTGILITDAAWQADSNAGANGVVDFSDGDGSTTFRIPDLHGEFLRGWTLNSARDPDQPGRGDAWQADEFESHVHTGEGTTGLGGTIGAGGAPYRNAATTPNTGAAGGAAETRPRNLPVRYWVFVGGVA